MPTGIETLVFTALISNSVTFSLAGSALAIQTISAAVTAGLFMGVNAVANGNRGAAPRQDMAKQTIQLRTYTSGNPDTWLPTTPVVMAGYPDFAWRAGNMEGLAADARVTWFDGDEGSPPSDLHHEAAIEIDNTTPAAPSLFGALISSSELHVRSLIFESRFLSGGSWVTAAEWPVRPGDTIDIAPYIINEDYEYRVFAATSDGTRSSPQPV